MVVPLKAFYLTSGPKMVFLHFFVSEEGLAHKSLMNFEPELKASQRFCSLFFNPFKVQHASTPALLTRESPPGDNYAQGPHRPLRPIPVRLHVLLTLGFASLRGQKQWPISLVRQIKEKGTSPISTKREIVLSASARALMWKV